MLWAERELGVGFFFRRLRFEMFRELRILSCKSAKSNYGLNHLMFLTIYAVGKTTV